MTRTPSGDGNRKKWTLSWWEKRGRNVVVTNGNEYTFHTDPSGGNNATYIYNYNNLPYYWEAGNTYIASDPIRDPAAWYNITVSYDSANVLALERIRLFINGNRITRFSTYGGLTLNQDSYWNSATAHYISNTSSGTCVDGYLAEIVFIDGQALDPSSFSETNDSGIWIPKDPSGLTFGSNGFYLKGDDSSALGADSSGNGNNWTTSGLNSYDKRNDSPTKNFAVWNPLTATAQTYSNGNLKATTASSAWKGGLTTMQVPLNSGTWYYEWYVTSAGSSSGQMSIGWAESNRSITDDNSSGDTEGWITYALNGNYYARSGAGSYGASYTTGDVIGCKINTNTSSNNVEWYKNGASQGTRSEALNLGGTGFISPYVLLYGSRDGIARFDNIDWTQTPSGITEDNAINSINLGS